METSSSHLSASEGVRLCPLCICMAAETAGGEWRGGSGCTQDEVAGGGKFKSVNTYIDRFMFDCAQLKRFIMGTVGVMLTLHRCRRWGQYRGHSAGRWAVGWQSLVGEELVRRLGEGGVDLTAQGVDAAVSLTWQPQIHLWY